MYIRATTELYCTHNCSTEYLDTVMIDTFQALDSALYQVSVQINETRQADFI